MGALGSHWKLAISIGVVVSMILGAIVVGVGTANPANAPVTTASSTSSPTLSTSSASSVASSVTPSTGGAGPHPGTLDVYEVSPAGATTEDPATAYDTVSYEPILNVYQTLINYNGNSTSTYVPTLATCVPGTAQCVTDYGTNLTGYVGSEPIYWTFVIDPAARFYDPSSHNSWSVYPTDVEFSIARTLAFADLPYAGKTAGWILAQALLPIGNPSYDSGIHFPYNNTPQKIYDSMLINDTNYCPAKAMNGVDGNGCITFVANGGGQDWPFFLELIADNLGGSIVPCGWFTAQSAGLPGWNGSKAAGGDGPCLLPNGGNSTQTPSWSTYVGAQAPASWDSFQKLELSPGWPAPQPGVQWSMLGSGPYYASVTPGSGYQLALNPAYAEPSGCTGGAGGTQFAIYTGYCDPAPTSIIPKVNVFWEPDDSFGISQYESGQADFAGIETTHTTTLLSLNASGKIRFFSFPTLSSFFTPVNLAFDVGAFSTDFPGQPLPNIPSDFFSNLALRQFYVMAYPYATVQDTVNTIDGVQYASLAGGPIPYGMGNYYPANVTFPYLFNNGVVETNPTVPGGAAWWWAQANDPSSPYYDSQLSACTPSTPCTWAIAGLSGFPAGDISIADWIAEIEAISGGALKPYGGSSFDLTFTQFLTYAFASPYTSPLVSEAGTGWSPDYPDPTDYMTPMFLPSSTYTAPDTFAQQLAQPAFNDSATCGHSAVNQADLEYWADQANFTNSYANDTFVSACQGVAYTVAVGMAQQAAAMKVGPARIQQYQLIEQISNALAMYVYNGQTDEVTSYAPWINPASINQNPMIGGGGDSVWFQVRYAGAETSVNFTETGLPTGQKWTVTLGTSTNSSTGSKMTFANQVNGTFPYTVDYISGYNVTPSNGTVTVAGKNLTVALAFQPMTTPLEPVYFNETGLVSNTTWGISIAGVGTVRSNLPSVEFNLTNGGTFNVTPTPLAAYNVSPVSENITVAGTTSVPITYTNIVTDVYALTFAPTGLPVGNTWTVTISGPKIGSYSLSSTAADSSITFFEIGGNFSASFTVPSGVTAPSGGVIVDLTNNTTIAVPLTATHDAFDLKFTETGLPADTVWNISVANATLGIANYTQSSSTASMTFLLANGSYNWSWAHINGWVATNPPGASNTTTVAGATVTVALAFTQYTYAVTFTESGLPSGSTWNITTTYGGEVNSTSVSLVTNLPNGTWSYEAGIPAGYAVLPGQNGTVTVVGNVTTVALTYVQVFQVTFTESGLPSGKTWTVYFNGVSKTSGGTTITFAVPNGTLSFGVSVPSGYLASPSAGSVTVSGNTPQVAVTITPSSSASSPSPDYLGTLAYILIGALALLAVIGLLLAAVFARRRPPASPPPKDWAPADSSAAGTGTGTGAEGGTTSSQNPPPPSG